MVNVALRRGVLIPTAAFSALQVASGGSLLSDALRRSALVRVPFARSIGKASFTGGESAEALDALSIRPHTLGISTARTGRGVLLTACVDAGTAIPEALVLAGGRSGTATGARGLSCTRICGVHGTGLMVGVIEAAR